MADDEDSKQETDQESKKDKEISEDEMATAAQKSYISSMSVEAHEPIPFELTKEEASKKIEELQKKTGRTDDTLAPQ